MKGLLTNRRSDRRAPHPVAPSALAALEIPHAAAVNTHVGVMLLPTDDQVIRPCLEDTGVWEPAETAFMEATIKSGMTVIDVGAHCGYFTLLAARLVGPRGRVVSFEPSPSSFELLQVNAWRNGLNNVTAFPWGVGAEAGDGTLFLAKDNTGDHRLVQAEDQRESVPVRVSPLDFLVPTISRADFIKVDTQGHEWHVLQGANELLACSPRAVLTIELWPFGLTRAGHDPREFVRHLETEGFRLQELNPFGEGPAPLDLDAVLDRCEREGAHAHTNLILRRS